MIVWGTTWYAITAQLAVVTPVWGVTVRFALAAAVILLMCRWQGLPLRFPGRVQALFALQGLTAFALSYVGVYEAERHVVSGVVAVGYAASPLVGLVLARLFLGTAMSARVALGGLIGLAGVAVIFGREFTRLGAPSEVALGAAITAASVLLSSLSTIVAARYQRDGIRGWPPLAWAMAWGAAGAFGLTLGTGSPWHWAWTPAFLGSLAYLTLAGSVATFGAFYALVHRVGPARAGYVGVMSPVVALAVSSALEGFTWTAATVAGVALALVGQTVAMGLPRRAPAA